MSPYDLALWVQWFGQWFLRDPATTLAVCSVGYMLRRSLLGSEHRVARHILRHFDEGFEAKIEHAVRNGIQQAVLILAKDKGLPQ